MLLQYFSIFVFLVLGLLFALAVVLLALYLGRKHKKSRAKLAAYECGFQAFNDARLQFNVRYYLIAIFFIIFDIEMAFLFPWALAFKTLAWPGIIAMGVFLGLLALGLIYEWRKGALAWSK